MIQENSNQKDTVITRTFLGYELNVEQNVIVNYLIPSILSCLLYIVHFACDFAVSYRHFRERNPIWGSITVFIMYLPAISCYVLTISSLELWPKFEGCGMENVKWCLLKTLQHIFFPIWSMWRFAEKIFWSVEGIRTKDDEQREDLINAKIVTPRTIELYYFLQGYLQAAPQILFQMHTLMRYANLFDIDTVVAQVLCVVCSLAQMAKTTTLFQRFKSQNLGGRCYPWYKPYKALYTMYDGPRLRSKPGIVYRCRFTCPRRNAYLDFPHQSPATDSRRSSDCYEQPIAAKDQIEFGRETSVIDGPRRLVLRDVNETDFVQPRRIVDIKALPEDDIGGKTISFIWWMCFLIARMLSISTFSYFYPTEIFWLLSGHFIIVIALLLYDVRHDEVRRAKAIFFIFIGFVYLFCLIEFKLKFKKPKFIYNGFFLLTFLENLVMVLIWWFRDIDEILQDYWYKFIFYIIIVCSLFSMLSMFLYLNVLKPKKVVINRIPNSDVIK
ncbi:hypothetical protein PPYR_08935 [Photinus pyralis]|uniref:XK-related protein n=1 Tax=Photinus pyralis TaxID=7054 RepID=A0A5N4AKR5_PHOPY|nr:uncharacterized protein LOC116170089 isoform X1 [Photinus pyralis]XP_031342138.1 uncharacterized protein LOC116170089 isoform X2 [Photinus pyralis]KAB0797942.1 hypothetical protein PPYR_08935 [Photinus pyralis]